MTVLFGFVCCLFSLSWHYYREWFTGRT